MENDSKLPESEEGLALIGFRIDPKNSGPNIYSLFIYGDQDIPVIAEGQILLFVKPELVFRAFELGDANIKRLGPPVQNVYLVCDIVEALNLIKNEPLDTSAVILNCLNTMFDLVQASGIRMPSEYRQILYEFADHLTFEREYESYIIQKNIQRESIVDAILWCIGAIVTRARILSE